MSCVSSEHLEILRLPELRDHCEKLGVPKSGNKGELISRLVTARIMAMTCFSWTTSRTSSTTWNFL